MAHEEPCGKLVRRTGAPDSGCLQQAAPHVIHDLFLLRHAWDGRNLRIGWTLWFITARELMDFFFVYERKQNKDGRFPDDVLAADYLPGGVWRELATSLQSEQPTEYPACRTAANKLSTHLRYGRVELAASGSTPPSLAVHTYLLRVASKWLGSLHQERRAWLAIEIGPVGRAG